MLPHLKYLYVLNNSSSGRENNYLFNPSNISHLHSICICDSSFGIRWSNGEPVLHILRSLMTTAVKLHDIYLQILCGCPNLIRLQTEFSSYNEERMQKNSICHLNLRQDMSKKMFEFMLSNVLNLTQYTVHFKVLQIALTISSRDDKHFRTCIQQAHSLDGKSVNEDQCLRTINQTFAFFIVTSLFFIIYSNTNICKNKQETTRQ
jgi:hypothetical protein